MVEPTGIGIDRVTETLAQMRAFGLLLGLPAPQVDVIIDAMEKELTEKPDRPGPPVVMPPLVRP